jgi:4,5-DOPA dioxygenase extradiol
MPAPTGRLRRRICGFRAQVVPGDTTGRAAAPMQAETLTRWTNMTAMPAVFFGHGSPMNTLQRNRHTDAWRAFGERGPRPRAVLAISAHWYLPGVAVTAMTDPPTIHDFGGFPPELHAFDYPAPGDPQLAARVVQLLAPLPATLDRRWGLDHGTWSVLAHVFPGADVPVVQLSIDADAPPRFHYELGQRLAPLRDEGVLIAGSGNVVHHLGLLRRDPDGPAHAWAAQFERRVLEMLARGEHAPLIDYPSLGRDAALAAPTPEHYLPLLYVLGAQRPDDAPRVLTSGIELGSISMLSFALEPTASSS